jgi:superfamily II DNA or RNA helicase
MKIPQAALVLADECHATCSASRLELLGHYPIVLGLTSTPALANGKGMGGFYTKIVQGPTMKQLVDWGFLVPMRYFGADAPDLELCKMDKDGDYQEKALAEATDKPELIGAIYDNYKKIAGDRTTLIFAVNCKHARHIHDEFKGHGVTVDYIDGSTPTEEREEIKQRVESGKTKVVVNIGVMAFGTDFPIISCVIIARVTRNICSWIQMIGRGSRLYPGKKDTIVIYHGANFDELGPIDDDIEWRSRTQKHRRK